MSFFKRNKPIQKPKLLQFPAPDPVVNESKPKPINDQRYKWANWGITNGYRIPTTEEAILATLMDIRSELHDLNEAIEEAKVIRVVKGAKES